MTKFKRFVLRVLFMASEAYPFVKTGGLADVAGSLPPALLSHDVDIRLFIPAYRGVKDKVRSKGKPISFGNPLGAGETFVIPGRHPDCDLPVYLLDMPDLFERSGSPYGDDSGKDWPDNNLRFALFSRIGALMGLAGGMMGFQPHIIHCNDWQTGLTPALLHQWGGHNIPSLFTIHNLAYQGNFSAWNREKLGISGEQFSMNGLEFHGQISYIKAGIRFSDHITTVSPTYAQEILTEKFGAGLDGLLTSRKDNLSGILNGIDDDIWNPMTDLHVKTPYNHENILAKKHTKKALLAEYNMASENTKPLIGIVSRLVSQKGLDLVLEAAEDVIASGMNFFILGSGSADLEEGFTKLSQKYPQNIHFHKGYDEALSHRIIAAADFMLIPSRFEPCGLTQMFAMRYGTLPIVRHTGGLADTVVDFSVRGEGSGVVFGYASKDDIVYACRRALDLFGNRRLFNDMRKRVLKKDFSWHSSAKTWIKLYQKIIDSKHIKSA